MQKEKTVICFCKHPEPGMVKSRLASDLGDQRASNIYKILLNNTLTNITQNNQSRNFKIFLYCYPDTQHLALSKLEADYSLTLKQQYNGDLGDKMYNAIKNHLSSNGSVILIGTDCLEIDAPYIEKAFNKLSSGNKVVLGPSHDGGYALIGANEIDKSIFENIDWGSNQVFSQTVRKLQELGWRFDYLPEVRDIDRLDDYQYFSAHQKYKNLFN